MKSNWIGLFFFLIFSLNPFILLASDEPLSEESEAKKPDQDKEDPLRGAEVTIVKFKERTIEEYRINGKLVQVKITPKHGYSYYLIDTDGDGNFDVRSSEAWKRTTVNTWKIFQW